MITRVVKKTFSAVGSDGANGQGTNSTATATPMTTTFSAVFTTTTFDPNRGPQMSYWEGIERLNVETTKETIPPTSSVATACWDE